MFSLFFYAKRLSWYLIQIFLFDVSKVSNLTPACQSSYSLEGHLNVCIFYVRFQNGLQLAQFSNRAGLQVTYSNLHLKKIKSQKESSSM